MHYPDGYTLGDYQIVEKIGAGGMGVVYRAFQLSLQREVALKILPDDLATNPQYLSRFAREARALTRLEHPHIVPVYDYGTVGKTSYLVMRLLTGGTLAEYLIHRGRLPIDDTRRILDDVSSALHYAHAQGIIHRDIKASNVIFDSQFNAYLTDFGIAKLTQATDGLTGTGMLLGTPHYMPPELWKGQPATIQSDIYSLGILLYAMLTGKPPFEADTPYALMEKHVNAPPRPPSAASPGLSPEMDAVLMQALAKQPDDRFQDAPSMTKAFANASWHLTPQLSKTPATGGATTLLRKRSQWRTGLAAILVIAVLVGALALLALLLPRRGDDAETTQLTSNATALALALQQTSEALAAASTAVAVADASATDAVETQTANVVASLERGVRNDTATVEALLTQTFSAQETDIARQALDTSQTADAWTETPTTTNSPTSTRTATASKTSTTAEAKSDPDGDGTVDGVDLCPDVAGPFARFGCPEPTVTPAPHITPTRPTPTGRPSATHALPTPTVSDRDGDGTYDIVDLCPDVAGPFARYGCPEPTITATASRTPTKRPLPTSTTSSSSTPTHSSPFGPTATYNPNPLTISSATLLQEGQLRQQALAAGSVSDLQISPDGTTIGLGLNNQVLFLDVTSLRSAATWQFSELQDWQYVKLQWSPTGDAVATFDLAHRYIYIWDVNTENLIATLTTTDPAGVWNAVWSPDGRWLAATGASGVCYGEGPFAAFNVWDTSDWSAEPIVVERGFATVGDLMWSTDGELLVTDEYCSGVTIWQAETWQQIHNFYDATLGSSLSPNGDILAAAGYSGGEPNGLFLYDTASWERLQIYAPISFAIQLVWEPAGQWLVTSAIHEDGMPSLLVINPTDAGVVSRIVTSDRVDYIGWSPDGSWIAFVESNVLNVWQVQSVLATAAPVDSDGDGLSDTTDPFPSLLDGDADGVDDSSDACPSEAGSVTNDGCLSGDVTPTVTPTASFRVVDVTFEAHPSEYEGNCDGVQVNFRGGVTVEGGSGVVTYQIRRSDGAQMGNDGRLYFDGPGTETITNYWYLGGAYTGWQELVILDPPQRSIDSSAIRARATFSITCE